jgi:hypothetical protein
MFLKIGYGFFNFKIMLNYDSWQGYLITMLNCEEDKWTCNQLSPWMRFMQFNEPYKSFMCYEKN